MSKPAGFSSISVMIFLVIALAWFTYSIGWPSACGGFFPDHPDRAIWMDAAWRIVNGQVPHKEFVSPIGAAWLYLNALPVALFGPQFQYFPIGVSIVFAISSVIHIIFFWLKQSPLAAFLSILYNYALLSSSQFQDYNAIAFLMLGLIVIESLTESKSLPGKINSGFLSGILISLLFFWKINFFVFGGLSVIILFPVFPKRGIWISNLVVGLMVTFILLSSSIEWRFAELFKDYNIPVLIKGKSTIMAALAPRGHASVILRFWFLHLIALVFFLFAWPPVCRNIGMKLRFSIRNPFGGLFYEFDFVPLMVFFWLIAIQNFLCLTNARTWEPYAVPWIALIGVCYFSNNKAAEASCFCRIKLEDWRKVKLSLSILLIGTPFLLVFAANILSHSANRKIQSSTAATSGNQYWLDIEDGLKMIRNSGVKTPKVVTIDYSNPFPPLLKLKPPAHDLLWWNDSDSFNDRIHPDADRILSDTDIVMIPKHPYPIGSGMIPKKKWEIFRVFISRDFMLKSESDRWALWVRKVNSI